MRIKKRHILLAAPLLLLGVFFSGPRADYPGFNPHLPVLELELPEVDHYIAEKEAKVTNLKVDNQARVIWADSIRKTPYSIVYLHGFSAGPMEADPVAMEFAQRYGCNLFLARLRDHGIDDVEVFRDLTPGDLIDDAKEALAIGKLIGDKVVLMSTSTGGTLSIYLAAQASEEVEALIMYSPNIALFSSLADMLTGPWGLQIARQLEGDYRNVNYPNEEIPKYWTDKYRTEGIVCLKYLMNATMTPENFAAVKQPLFIGCYYKNEEEQDRVVSVKAMRDFFGSVSTPEDQKRFVEFPNVGSHVVAHHLKSKDLDEVREATNGFAEQVLGWTPK